MATHQRGFETSLGVRSLLVLIVTAVCLWAPGGGVRAQDTADRVAAKRGPSGLPLPRFVSLKSDRVNVRKGPSTDHPVAWIFSRAGLPVEVVAESEHWRRVRDSEGSEGWVFHSLLSGRRTALVMPWVKRKQSVPLFESRSTGGTVAARLESGVLGSVLACDGTWCELTTNGVSGWIEQERLWGVYRGERIR